MPTQQKDPLAKATRAAEDLYHLRDTYFPANPDDKISKLQQQSDLALKLLDSIPQDTRKLPMQRATFEYLRGKILDVFPDYRKEAEDHLSKAVKLNPSLADAWLCLGNCIWKKGDLSSAKNCFNLALSKGPNKSILCQLSMLERKMAQGTENQAELVEESIQHAKEAITLDVKDGNSWYNLGNAWLTSFFVSGAWDHSKLLHSLKAYQNADKDEKMKSNPDLYFNSATVNQYLENYERALSGFEAASVKDPGLNAAEQVQKIVNLLDKLQNLFRGHIRKQLQLVGKVLFFVKHDCVTPLYYLLCDSNQACFVLSVYGLHSDAIKEGDQLTLLEPYFRCIDISWKEKCYQFKSIRVDFLEQILVNGKTLRPYNAVRTSIYAQHKS
ncbi:Tetratricopeptide repeat protein 5 [Quillaja saponaria]|uniref:Tetratricopeptide repeat protein 5 n=1 Tax=Quillaja saponaria TaxID=32244 RepID=A0AAD7KNE7_QUISA|nr:Tetratricopeptide repeat protein 5 [Quillaja saponaria]